MVQRKVYRLDFAADLPFYVLIGLLVASFSLGGSARPDVPTLVFLRPLNVLALTYGLWGLKWADVERYRFLFAMALVTFALVILQLIPLPPTLWHRLPGRALIVDIDHVAGLGEVWRPVSMAPIFTWNAFFALIGPLATLVLAAQVGRERRYRLLPILTAIGLVSGLIGFLQILGPPDGPLYFYSITNNGAAVGLFANRNHQALLLDCLFPMVAVLVGVAKNTFDRLNIRLLLGSAAALFLVPLVLVTGSRAGLVIGVLALLSAIGLYRRPQLKVAAARGAHSVRKMYFYAPIILVFMGVIAVLGNRAEAIQRLLETDELHGGRLIMWKTGWQVMWKYFPIGPGVGTIVPVYQIDEGRDILATTYVNHLHNDWLELLVCGGAPAAALLAITVFAYFRQLGIVLSRSATNGREFQFARLGAIVIFLLALGSIGDYPLRTPSLECVLVIAAVWFADGRKAVLSLGEASYKGGSHTDAALVSAPSTPANVQI